ncbi:MAG: hypothetical protein L0Z53_01890 [Acidobacteriales bacterium]|nr:hypothetical protein [Terriglobales bacterium]
MTRHDDAMRLLTRQGYVIEEQGMTYLGDTDPEAALAPLQQALHLPHSVRPAGGSEGADLTNAPQPSSTAHAATLCQ